MTWAETKLLIVHKLNFDGSSKEDLQNTALSSGFDLRSKLLLQQFCRYTYYIWHDRAALTLAANDYIVQVSNTAKCAKAIYEVMDVWLSDAKLAFYSPRQQEVLHMGQGTIQSGTPATWSQLSEGKIRFEKKVTGAIANSYVSGFGKHDDITSDGQTLDIQDWDFEPLISFTAANFMQPVAASDIGIGRLRMYDAAAAAAMDALRARNMRRFFGSREIA